MAYHPFRHLGLKLLAIAMASVLWLTVAGEQIVERSLRVPVEFRNVPARLEIVGEPPGAVDVRVRGSSGVLSRLEPGSVVAVVDLASARPGARLFHLRNNQVKAPFGVEVAQVVPATIALELEALAERTVPLVPSIEGEPAPGYVLGPVSAVPDTVRVVGPASRVRQLVSATTEPLSVDGATAAVADVLTVGVMDTAVRLAEPVEARVTADVLPAPIERTLRGVPVELRNVSAGLMGQAVPPAVAVSVRGSRQALNRLRVDQIGAFVDLAGLGPGRYNLPVSVEPDQAFGVTGLQPEAVEIRVTTIRGGVSH